jgi:type VI secretion system protein ImpM
VPTETVRSTAVEALGVYGKLPARGDFVSRRMGRSFVDAWDDWLQQAIPASQLALGDRWLDLYLTSPIWRFALGAGCCGPNTVVGVMMPSVDKVGRYFPLMLGRELPPGVELLNVVTRLADWYGVVEDRALSVLVPAFQLEELEGPLPLGLAPPFARAGAAGGLVPPGHYIAVDPSCGLAEVARVYGPLPRERTIWWTAGSEHIVPSILLCPELPAPTAYASLYDGEWEQRGWFPVRL